VAREVTYGNRVSTQTAHQLSVLTGIGAFAVYFWALQRRWPVRSSREALKIGGWWLLLTAGAPGRWPG
jgi:hypothetical protein